MTNIVNFTRKAKATVNTEPEATIPMPKTKRQSIGAALIKGIWVFTVLVWPILKWIISIDCFFQFIRMFYHWNTPGIYAGWTFLLHFSVLTALTYFVSIYKPKEI